MQIEINDQGQHDCPLCGISRLERPWVARSRYGLGDICPDCGKRESLVGYAVRDLDLDLDAPARRLVEALLNRLVGAAVHSGWIVGVSDSRRGHADV